MLLGLLKYLLKYLLEGKRGLRGILNKGLYELLDWGTDILLVISIVS